MILGNIGVALCVKKIVPRMSLGWLFLGALLPDLTWSILTALSVQTIEVDTRIQGVWPVTTDNLWMSHSALMVLLLGGLTALIYFRLKRRPDALWLCALPLMNWVLAVLFHRSDLPLFPWSQTGVGYGVWNSVNATLVIQYALFCIGLMAYWLMARGDRLRFNRPFWIGMIVVAGIGLGSIITSPQTSSEAIHLALYLWLFIPVGYWIDYHRPETYRSIG
ncbi:hypothetical protein EB093_04370 [bacterium]|nr:hypothetical protein [bacterium]